MAKSKLGRGLLSIISELNNEGTPSVQENVSETVEIFTPEARGGVEEISVALIDVNPFQPRKSYDPDALSELSESIKQFGVLQPVILAPNQARFTIIAGERRYRASVLAGLGTVPAIVKELSVLEQKEIALVENLQREDLNPMDEAEAYSTLIKEFGVTQEELSKVLGKSRPAITNSLRLLSLTKEVSELVRRGSLSAGHARALAAVKDPILQVELAKIAEEKGMSVRALESFIKASLGEKQQKTAPKYEPSLELRSMLKNMSRLFDTKVKLSGNDNKGKLIIEYYTRVDLERIYELFEKLKEIQDD